MSLRTRLIVVFLLVSVVPLAAVTAYQYQSSADALQRVAREEADRMTVELGSRMEWVTAEVGDRVERLWDLPRRPPLPSRDADDDEPRMAALPAAGAAVGENIADLLGMAAHYVERVEVMSDAMSALDADQPAPPAAVAPAPPVPPVPPAPPSFVIDMAAIREEMKKAGVPVDEWGPDVERTMAEGMRMGLEAARAGIAASADVVREQTRAAAAQERERQRRRAETRAVTPAPKVRARTEISGRDLDVMIEEDGKPMGKVSATLKLDRVLQTVVSMTSRDRREIAFAIDPSGALVAATDDDRAVLEQIGLPQAAAAGFAPSQDWLVVMRDDPSGSGVRFGIARRIGESLGELRAAAARNLMVGLGLVGLAIVGIVPLSGRLTRNVRTLTDGVNHLAAGNYGSRVEVRSKDEIGRLAVAFNNMAGQIEAQQKLVVEQERLKRELELCRQIQTDMLPHGPLRLGFAEVKGLSIPAREVGGDFFNYFALDDNRMALLVGDVSGKGVSAALTMANVQATLRARMPLESDLARLADLFDRDFDRNTPRTVYATLFVGVLDRATRTLRYVNAGHHPQFVLRREGGLEKLPSTGMPIGLFAGQGYAEASLELREGDLLFFYTDGAVETENEAGDMFGSERLEALLAVAHNEDVDAVLERAERAVREFRGAAEPFDDATMMALKVSL